MDHGEQFGRPFAVLKVLNRYIHFLRLFFIGGGLVMVVVVAVAMAVGLALLGALLALARLARVLPPYRVCKYPHTAPEDIDHVFRVYY